MRTWEPVRPVAPRRRMRILWGGLVEGGLGLCIEDIYFRGVGDDMLQQAGHRACLL